MAYNGSGTFRISIDKSYNDGNYIEFNGTGAADGFSTRIGIQRGASNRRFNIYNHNGGYEQFVCNANSGANILTGIGTTTGQALLVQDNASTERFKVLDNGNLYTNGTQGLSNTYTFGGGSTGDIASMTFTNGILTAVTTVP